MEAPPTKRPRMEETLTVLIVRVSESIFVTHVHKVRKDYPFSKTIYQVEADYIDDELKELFDEFLKIEKEERLYNITFEAMPKPVIDDDWEPEEVVGRSPFQSGGKYDILILWTGE